MDQAPPYSVGALGRGGDVGGGASSSGPMSLCLAFVGCQVRELSSRWFERLEGGGHSGRGGERVFEVWAEPAILFVVGTVAVGCPYVRTIRVVKKTVRQKPTMAEANPMV